MNTHYSITLKGKQVSASVTADPWLWMVCLIRKTRGSKCYSIVDRSIKRNADRSVDCMGYHFEPCVHPANAA